MEWRCEWCGKPHAEDDPPCDNCGHGRFERAVVPAGPEGEGGPLVWVCTDCGREHPRNNPPCSRCGAMDLEQRRQEDVPAEPLDDGNGGGGERRSVRDLLGGDEADDEGPETMTVWACTECGRAHPRNNPPCSRCGGMSFRREERVYEGDGDWQDGAERSRGPGDGDVAETMTTWVCTECGRSHPRNNPPCNRCGGMSFEQRERRFDDVDTSGGGWLDAVDWRVVAGFVGVLALVVLAVGPAMGVFDLPGEGPPPVTDVPGEADTVGGVPLAAVERSFVARLETAGAGDGELSWNRELSGLATYRNRWLVKAAYTDADRPTPRPLLEAARNVDTCDGGDITYVDFRTPPTIEGTGSDGFASAEAMAATLVEYYAGEDGTVDVAAPKGEAAADVHVAPDGRVFVTVFFC